MIKGLNTGGRYIQVTGGSIGATYINNYSGAAGVGNLRYNPSSQNIEVYDGNNWQQLAMGYATVDLTHDAQSLLDWVALHRSKEQSRKAAVEKNPALKKAYEAIQRAEENFDLLEAIAGKYDSEEGLVQSAP